MLLNQKQNKLIELSILFFSPVSPDDLQKAFSVVDPYIKKPDIDAYLVSAYRVSDKEKLSEVEPLSHDVLFKRLELMNIRKHSQFEN